MLLWWRRRRKVVPAVTDRAIGRARLRDGDTVPIEGYRRPADVLRERARTDERPLLTPGQEHRTRKAPWLNPESTS